jgi:hypothetical protein
MQQDSETAIDKQMPYIYYSVIRAMRVRMPRCELKWEKSDK